MSLVTTVGAGALLGTVLAVGVYNVVAPAEQVPASVDVAPTFAPVPTPTVTEEDQDCVAPAVLEDDECIVHVPGPTVTLPAAPPATQGTATTGTSQGRTDDGRDEQYGDDDSQDEGYGNDDSYDDEAEHEDGDHEDGDHEDGDHEDGEHEDGEHEDD